MPNAEQPSSKKQLAFTMARRSPPVPDYQTNRFFPPNRNKTNHFTSQETNPLTVRLVPSLPEVPVYRPTIPCNLETRGTRGSR